MLALGLTPLLLWRVFLLLSIFTVGLSGQAVSASKDCGQKLVTRTISSQADATVIAGCSTFTGSLVIATNLPASDATINFGGLQEIDGSLSARSVANLQNLNASQLLRINGDFSMTSLPNLNVLAFPQLLQTAYFTLNDLPAVPHLDFSADALDGSSGLSADTVIFFDNQFATLPINLRNVTALHMRNNTLLSSISLPLEIVRQKININHIGTLDLRLLTSVDNMTLASLEKIDLTNLESVRDLSVTGAALTLELPSLVNSTNIRLESTRPDFNCSTFDLARSKGVISGNYSCNGTHQIIVDVSSQVAIPSSSSRAPSTTSSSTSIVSLPTTSAPTALPGNAVEKTSGKVRAIAIAATISVIGSLALVSSVLYLFWRSRRINKLVPEPPPKDMSSSAVDVLYGKSEMDSEGIACRELDAGEIRPELDDGNGLHEMEDGHGVTEMGSYDPKDRYELPGSGVEGLKGTAKENWI